MDEQGLSKLTFTGDEESQKVKQPNPSGARSKLDLERKYGPGKFERRQRNFSSL